ncbi:hypothetical protein GLOIN_2v1777628 [Rhizophagus clarus]|uniref:Uncharacterized protein n=1 Tax=Rhizophagus clarus TaxID=94130 RepID=A0A8H3KUX0_9GLOM|nr:hypothetical protein GLOIN_2v1777628 [Rhizophagus clarus]
MTFEKVLDIITLITNYANIHGLPSPGRHFHEDTLPIIFLPASESYSSLYRLYVSTMEDENQSTIHLTIFWRIWNKYIPEIKFLSPRNDLCFKCKEMRLILNIGQNKKTSLKKRDKIAFSHEDDTPEALEHY